MKYIERRRRNKLKGMQKNLALTIYTRMWKKSIVQRYNKLTKNQPKA